MSDTARRFVNDFAISIILMSLLLGAVYLFGNDTYSVVDYLDGMGDFVTGPIYPGIFLYYPPFGVVILIGSLAYCYKLEKRRIRLPLIFAIVFAWMCLGLLTSVQYFG